MCNSLNSGFFLFYHPVGVCFHSRKVGSRFSECNERDKNEFLVEIRFPEDRTGLDRNKGFRKKVRVFGVYDKLDGDY